MEFEEVQLKHAGAVTRTLNDFYRQFEIHKSEIEKFRTNALSELWENTRGLEEVNASYVITSVRWSCMRTFRESHLLGDGGEDCPEIEVFNEDFGFSSEMLCNNRLTGLHTINGKDFPDLDHDDLAVIDEYLATPVTDRSRRQTLRRRVDLILLKLGIDSSEIHEYTSRNRRSRRNCRTE